MTDHAGVALSAEVAASLDAARHQRTAARDAWLAALFDAAVAGNSAGLALVAVGGYGRRELGPGSDLDVVLLHTGRDDVERIAERIWYPIWDAGQRLDHSVRTISETLAVAASDLRVLLGLLHARTLRGDPALVPTVRE
ncbi:MAG: [protein-PII] uridylyltransferase, partial [Acidothermus cellulolyticus]|nr:[protein-PII] uridylyltransferase [Acidothermus cellulolyticus]